MDPCTGGDSGEEFILWYFEWPWISLSGLEDWHQASSLSGFEGMISGFENPISKTQFIINWKTWSRLACHLPSDDVECVVLYYSHWDKILA